MSIIVINDFLYIFASYNMKRKNIKMITERQINSTRRNDKLVEKINCQLRRNSALMRNLPSFQSGFSSIFGINRKDLLSDYMKGNNIDDIKNDWKTIGNDLRRSMINFSKR